MGEEMESKGAMDGPGYEPMGDGRKTEGDYRGGLEGAGPEIGAHPRNFGDDGGFNSTSMRGRSRKRGRSMAGSGERACAEGGAREREELRRRRMDGVRDPSTLRCPPQREAWWFLAASRVSKTQRPNKTRFPSLSSLNCLPRHQNADVAP